MLVNLLLFGNPEYTEIGTSRIINATIKYLLDSERFNNPLLWLTKHLDFGYFYSWLILDFLFVFNPNAYDKHKATVAVLSGFMYMYFLFSFFEYSYRKCC